jgi:hypothetical protein
LGLFLLKACKLCCVSAWTKLGGHIITYSAEHA